MKEKEIKRAVIYVRVSSNKQVEGTSLDQQVKECEKYCKENNMERSYIFRDEGASAKSANRPEFMEAIGYCKDKKNKINSFVVWKVDRFARNAEDHFAVRKTLADSGVSLVSVTEAIGDDPASKFMESMLAASAEFDNGVRRQRAISGMSARIKEGIVPGNAPVGYVSPKCNKQGKKKKIPDTPHPDIFPILQKGLREFAEGGMTKADMGRRFQDLGLQEFSRYYTTKQGIHKFFDEKRINFFAGYIWNPYTEEYCEGVHEKMITIEERDAIFLALKNKTKPQGGKIKNPLFPLRGTICCEVCSRKMTASSSTGRKGKKYPSYHCQNNDCEFYSKTRDLSAEIVNGRFQEELNKISISDNKRQKFLDAVIKEWDERKDTYTANKQRLARLLEIENKKRNRVFEMREDGSYSKEEFVERKDEIDKKINVLALERDALNGGDLEIEELLKTVTGYVSGMGDWWKSMQLMNKTRFQLLLFPAGITYKKKASLGITRMGYLVKLFSNFETNKSLIVDRFTLHSNFMSLPIITC